LLTIPGVQCENCNSQAWDYAEIGRITDKVSSLLVSPVRSHIHLTTA
jgi:hypothetical protein